jgi:EpsI family protein
MASTPASRQPYPRRMFAAGLCALAGLAVFQFFGNASRGYIPTGSLFYWWGYQWTNPASELGHAWLILPISLWLFWRNLQNAERGSPIADRETQNPKLKTQNLGAVSVMVVALALHALGFVAQQARISIVALLLFIWGVLRLAGGPRWGTAAVFPLAFMAFAIPVDVLDSLGFWLRVWVVKASAIIAHAAGIGVLQSGTQLLAPDGSYNYDVAAACSGINSLTALVALSLLAGYLNLNTWWRRALVFLLCFPLVYLGNVARIVSIIFAAQIGGPKWGDIAHEVMGYGIFVIVLGGVLAAIAALQRWWPESPEKCHLLSDTSVSGSRETERQCHLLSDTVAWSVSGVVVALAVGEMFFLHHIAHAPARGGVGVTLAADGLNPAELPTFIGTEWIGRPAAVSPVEREMLPADTGFSRKSYAAIAAQRREVFLSIVLSGRDRSSIHRPELCLVGQGWTITDSTSHRFGFAGHPAAAFTATILRVRREVPTKRGKVLVPQLVAYWFVGGDSVVATHWQRFARDAWNRVRGRTDRWAYVLMQTDATDGEAAALARMQSVLDGTLPAFQRPLGRAASR